jgi:hypothetical protein
MCEECGEAPVQFVAYFNKAGGKHWRPPQRAAAVAAPTPLVGDGRGGGAGDEARPRINSPIPTRDPSPAEPRHDEATPIIDPSRQQPARIGGGEKRAFVCEETRTE